MLRGSSQTWGRSGQRRAPGSDLRCGALQAVLSDRDDVGGQDAAEDVEVQEIGFISVGGEEVYMSGPGQVQGTAGLTSRRQWAQVAQTRTT